MGPIAIPATVKEFLSRWPTGLSAVQSASLAGSKHERFGDDALELTPGGSLQEVRSRLEGRATLQGPGPRHASVLLKPVAGGGPQLHVIMPMHVSR